MVPEIETLQDAKSLVDLVFLSRRDGGAER
jgi:hypothetical protein